MLGANQRPWIKYHKMSNLLYKNETYGYASKLGTPIVLWWLLKIDQTWQNHLLTRQSPGPQAPLPRPPGTSPDVFPQSSARPRRNAPRWTRQSCSAPLGTSPAVLASKGTNSWVRWRWKEPLITYKYIYIYKYLSVCLSVWSVYFYQFLSISIYFYLCLPI